MHSRFIISPTVSPIHVWHVVRYKKFPQKLTRTNKRIMQRQITIEKRRLNEAPKEAPKEETNESLDPIEEATPKLKITKFERRATEDAKSICSSNKETYSGIILICTIYISLNCSTSPLTLSVFFKPKKMEENQVEVKKKQPTTDEDRIYKGITTEPSKGSRPQNVIFEKPTMEITKTFNVKSTRGTTQEVHQWEIA